MDALYIVLYVGLLGLVVRHNCFRLRSGDIPSQLKKRPGLLIRSKSYRLRVRVRVGVTDT